MSEFGLYAVDASKYLDNSGKKWSRHSLCCNGERICTALNESNKLGLIAYGKKLLFNGEIIAISKVDVTDGVSNDHKFGDADLLGHTVCINITKTDYENLYTGKLVKGYKKYDSQAIYNIVSNVETAPVVSCIRPNKGRDFIYNNINPEGLVHNVLTDATFIANRTPQLSVHDVSLRVEITDGVCEPVTLMYMVDTKDLQKLHFDKIDDTFTTIVKDSNGRELYKNTTFAGEFWIEFDLFKYGTPAEGETYFSIECIDNHGVGSVVQFIEVGVFNKEVPNYYDVEQHIGDDITATTVDDVITSLSFVYNNKTYTLYLNDDTELYAYRNKLSLTALFAKVKAAGYNGVKLYNADVENPTTYYVTYHKDIGGNQDYDNPTFGSQTYYVCKVESEVRVGDLIPIVQGQTLTLGTNEFYVDCEPVEFIGKDGAYLHRVPAGITNDDVHEGKVWVWWRDDGSGWTESRKTEFPHLRVYDPDTELCCRNYYENPFKSYSSFGLRTYPSSTTNFKNKPDGYYYFAQNTEEFGDSIAFPDNFTIDLNNTVLQITQNVGVGSGYIIAFDNNYNLHICNGVISGLYNEYNFKNAFLARGSSTLGISEALSNIRNYGSRYCSLVNVESRWSVGYDCINYDYKGNAVGISGGTNQNSFSFDNVGYISLDGSIRTAPPLREVTYKSNSISYDAFEGLVYDNTYHQWNFKYGPVGALANSDECYIHCLYLVPFMNGKEHELFMHFYSYDSNTETYTYISSIKTMFRQVIKCPVGTTHYRISAYGIIQEDNGSYVSYMHTFNTGHPINAAFYDFEITSWSNKESHGMLYKGLYCHHHKSSAFSCETSGVTFDSCTVEAAGCIPYLDWFVTKLLGATEDGRQHTKTFTIKNGTFRRLYSGATTSADLTDTVGFKFIYGRNVTVINNHGLTVADMGDVCDLYLANNTLRGLKNCRMSPTAHGHFVYVNNNIFESYSDSFIDSDKPVDYANTVTDTYKESGSRYNNLRGNNCDEPISGNISMTDCFLVKSDYDTKATRKNMPRYKRSNIDNNVVNQRFDDAASYFKDYYYFNYDANYYSDTYNDVNFSNDNYKPIIVGRPHNPVDVFKINIDGTTWESPFGNYSANATEEEDYIKYIKPAYIQPRLDGKNHEIFCNYSRVSTTHGAIQITAWNILIIPALANTLGAASANKFCQRYCFDGPNGVLVFLGKTPPYFEIGYRDGNTHTVNIAEELDDVQNLVKIKVPIGCSAAYKARLKSTSKNSVDQSFLDSIVEECEYEELISYYPGIELDMQAGRLFWDSSDTTYNGFPERHYNGIYYYYVTESVNSLRNRLLNNYSMVEMLDLHYCYNLRVRLEEDEGLYAFYYDSDGHYIRRKAYGTTDNGAYSVANNIAKIENSHIPENARYVKFQVTKSTAYDHVRKLEITFTGSCVLVKNTVPNTENYGIFRFETHLPDTIDDGERHFDSGCIMLPEEYTLDGEPVPLILYLRGSTENNDFFIRANNSTGAKIARFFCQCGYAVADCSGVTDVYCNSSANDSFPGEGIGSPTYMNALTDLIKYIGNNYNVNIDGVYIGCKSIGGIMAARLAAEQPFHIKAIGMFSPALSTIISLNNHARYNPGGATMEAEQIGIDYTFTKNQFNSDDKEVIIENIDKWRTIDGFFKSTDLTDTELKAVVQEAQSRVGNAANSGLSISTSVTQTIDEETVTVDLSTKKRHVSVPTKIFISSGDEVVFYSNSALYVNMVDDSSAPCVLQTMEALSSYQESHNVCTTSDQAQRFDSYTAKNGNVITEFNGKAGVPRAMAWVVDWFNNDGKITENED